MSRADLDLVLDWAAGEGWNPGLDDAEAFLATDPQGFFIRRVDGTPAAAISVVNLSPEFAFLGLYICHEAFRGQGHGLALWTEALRHAGSRCVGLDGVVDQQENYARSGFERAGRTLRLCGRAAWQDSPDVRMAGAADIPVLARIDAAAIGVRRTAFLDSWLAPRPTRRTYLVEQPGCGAAFATCRTCRTGAKAGPFYADTAEAAEALLAAMEADLGDGPLCIDVPEGSPLEGLLIGRGFEPVFETARMYRGTRPTASPPPYHAVGTLELG